MTSSDKSARVAYSPSEFAALFGKSPTWGYRQLYSGKIKAISGEGRLAIPASEVERLTGSAAVYNGKPTVRKKIARPKVAPVKVQKTWPEHLKERRHHSKPASKPKKAPEATGRHAAAIERMAKLARKQAPADLED